MLYFRAVTSLPLSRRTIHFDVLGIPIEVTSHLEGVLDDFQHDFEFFLASGGGHSPLRIVVRPCSERPHWTFLFKVGRARLYLSRQGERRVCFFEKAWVSYCYREARSVIYADEAQVAYQAAFYVVQSYVGEAMDRMGTHRVHGLAMSWNGRATVLMAPSGGGKSTLALRLLSQPQFGLYSDDIAFVTREGTLIPFPLRIASSEAPDIEDGFVRRFVTEDRPTKFVVRSSYFKSRVPEAAPLVVLGCLKRGSETRWASTGRIRLLIPLVRWLIIGHETPQIWELFLRFSPRDLISRIAILFSRVRLAMRLFLTCHPVLLEIEEERKTAKPQAEPALVPS